MYGVDFICIGCGLAYGEQQNIGHLQKTKKVKIEQSSMLNVEWKATIEAELVSLVAGMAKVEPMVDSINEIKAMLQQKQRSKHQKLLPHE